MAYVLHLRDVPPSADEGVIWRSFSRFSIPKGGIHILGGTNGDVLIDFEEDSEILQALALDRIPIHGKQIRVFLERVEDKTRIIADVIKSLASAPTPVVESTPVKKKVSSKPVDKGSSSKRAASSSTPAAFKVATSANQTAGTTTPPKTAATIDRIAAAPWNMKPKAQAALSNDSQTASQKTSGQTSSTSKSPKSSAPPWASKDGQTGDKKMAKSTELKSNPAKSTATTWASRAAPSANPLGVPVPTPQAPTPTSLLPAPASTPHVPAPAPTPRLPALAPQAAAQNYQMGMQTRQAAAQNYQMARQAPQAATQNYQMAIQAPQAAVQNYQMAIQAPQAAAQNYQMATQAPQAAAQNYQMATQAPQATTQNYQMAKQALQAATQNYQMATQAPQAATQNYQMATQTPQAVAQNYQMVRQAMLNTTVSQAQLVGSMGLPTRLPVSVGYPRGTQVTPFRQLAPAPMNRPPMSASSPWGNQVATSSHPLPAPAQTPDIALAADIAKNVSMGTNRFSSPFNQTGQPLLMRAIAPQNAAPSNSKNIPLSSPVPLASQNLKSDGLKQQKPPAKPAVKDPISEVIIIKESDEDSSSDDYQMKFKKSKVDGSGANNVKSVSDKEQIKNRIYRSRGRSRSTSKEKAHSKSRSRSRSRSRSQSKSRKPRGRDRSSSKERDMFGRDKTRRRDRSRSREGDRSRRKERSSSQGRNRSRGRSRSRSRGRNHGRNRSRSRERHRSRSKERDRSRERDGDSEQKSRKTDKDKSKPANTKHPGLVQYPDRMNISTWKFKNDPNSIIVLNIAKTVSMYLFRKLFYGHAIAQDGIALKPSENNPNVQTAYVKFVHKSSAEAAKKLSGTALDGRKVVIKSATEDESGPPIEPEFRETLKTPLKTLDIPPPRESPFRMLGASEETTCYVVTIRGFKPGTTACAMWSWFGGPTGDVKGVIVSHRVRKKDDEAAFLIYKNLTSRNANKLPRDIPNLVQYRYTEQATIRKLLSNDVSVLTESTLFGDDRAVTEAEKKRLEVLSSKLLDVSQSPPEQPLWKRLTYLCLYETPKGTTATQVWSWLGGENGRAQCVILAHCTSQNELQDGRYHVAFVGFGEARFVKQEMQRLGHGREYSADETMRFLARQPDSCPIFVTTTFGQDHVLPRTEREQLREKYLTEEQVLGKQKSEPPKQTQIPIGKEFELSDVFSGLCLLQHKGIPITSTACKVWSWHQLESNKCRGVVLVKDGSIPRFAFAAFEDVEVRNEAYKARQLTGKATWGCGIRHVANWVEKGSPVFISTKSGIDRPITYKERAYLIETRDASIASNAFPTSSSPMDIEENSDEEEHNLGMVTPSTQTSGNNQIHKEAAIAAVATGDNSEQYYYLRIRKLPENVTACRVWTWFDGAAGNSKSALVVYGANKVAACAFVGFEKEIHRDMAITNQRFANPCNYHSRGVYLTELEPGFKITESTVSGLDREFTELDMDVMKYKLRQIAQQKKAEKPVSNVTVPDDITRIGTQFQEVRTQLQVPSHHLRGAQAADVRTPLQMPPPNVKQEDRSAMPPPQVTAFNPSKQSMWAHGQQGLPAPNKGNTDPQMHRNPKAPTRWDSQGQEERPKVPELMSQPPKIQPPGTEHPSGKKDEVEYLLQPDNTIYFRLVKLRPNITAGEVWSWFRGSRGPTHCATLVRDSDGTALFAFVGFVTDHTSFIEDFEVGSFTLCGPKARNIELISLDTSVQVIQSSKQGDKRVSAETMSRFKERVIGEKRAGATNTQPQNQPVKPESPITQKPPTNLQGLTARILQMGNQRY